MQFSATFLPFVLAACALASPIQKRAIDKSCDAKFHPLIQAELKIAYDMAMLASQKYSANGKPDNPYHFYGSQFFDAATIKKPNHEANRRELYANIAKLLGPQGMDITCENSKKCANGFIAYVNKQTQKMNLCPIFFTESKVDLDVPIAGPGSKPPVYDSAKLIAHAKIQPNKSSVLALRPFGLTRAHVLVHETTHADKSVPKGGFAADDYAYSVNGAIELAKGVRKLRPGMKALGTVHPEMKKTDYTKTVIPAKYSEENADSIALVASGIYFSTQVGTVIPIKPIKNPDPEAVQRWDDFE